MVLLLFPHVKGVMFTLLNKRDMDKITKEIEKLQKRRDKSTNTFEIIRLASKIKKLKESLSYQS